MSPPYTLQQRDALHKTATRIVARFAQRPLQILDKVQMQIHDSHCVETLVEDAQNLAHTKKTRFGSRNNETKNSRSAIGIHSKHSTIFARVP
jgi:hypothetical protein